MRSNWHTASTHRTSTLLSSYSAKVSAGELVGMWGDPFRSKKSLSIACIKGSKSLILLLHCGPPPSHQSAFDLKTKTYIRQTTEFSCQIEEEYFVTCLFWHYTIKEVRKFCKIHFLFVCIGLLCLAKPKNELLLGVEMQFQRRQHQGWWWCGGG